MQRGHSKPHASAHTVFANSRFTAFGCKHQLIQGLLPRELLTVAEPVSCRFKLPVADLHCS